MSVKLLTEHHLEFLSLKGGCTDSSGSTLVKIPHCWKSHVAAHLSKNMFKQQRHRHLTQYIAYQTHVFIVALIDMHIASCLKSLLNETKSCSNRSRAVCTSI